MITLKEGAITIASVCAFFALIAVAPLMYRCYIKHQIHRALLKDADDLVRYSDKLFKSSTFNNGSVNVPLENLPYQIKQMDPHWAHIDFFNKLPYLSIQVSGGFFHAGIVVTHQDFKWDSRITDFKEYRFSDRILIFVE